MSSLKTLLSKLGIKTKLDLFIFSAYSWWFLLQCIKLVFRIVHKYSLDVFDTISIPIFPIAMVSILIFINHMRLNRQRDLDNLKNSGIRTDANVVEVTDFHKRFSGAGLVKYEFNVDDIIYSYAAFIYKQNDLHIILESNIVNITYLPNDPNISVITST